MCLTVDKTISKKFRNGKFIAYKVFRESWSFSDNRYFYAQLHYNKSSSGFVDITRSGNYVSTRQSKQIGGKWDQDCIADDFRYDTTIGCGIHVFLNKKDAYAMKNGRVIVPVICDKKDLVAFGRQGSEAQAVFMKVKIKNKKDRKMCVIER